MTTQHRSWFERLSQTLLREPKDREQLIELLYSAHENDLLDDEAMQMIEGVLEVSQMQVREAMVPRPRMAVIEENMTPQEALPRMIEAGHSRFPVIGEDPEKIVGVLLAKDLLQFNDPNHQRQLRIRDVMRPATYIPESKRLNVLLQEFRLNHNHMAIVLDEYGNIAGLITIEDVLEQIVGQIEDEYDTTEDEPDIKQVSDKEFRVKALTSIQDFNEYFTTEYDGDDYDTFGGLVLQKFSHLPKRGESTTIGEFQVTVLQAGSRDVKLLLLTKIEPEDEEEEN
jgi:magnesium and cobalt transporter